MIRSRDFRLWEKRRPMKFPVNSVWHGLVGSTCNALSHEHIRCYPYMYMGGLGVMWKVQCVMWNVNVWVLGGVSRYNYLHSAFCNDHILYLNPTHGAWRRRNNIEVTLKLCLSRLTLSHSLYLCIPPSLLSHWNPLGRRVESILAPSPTHQHFTTLLLTTLVCTYSLLRVCRVSAHGGLGN